MHERLNCRLCGGTLNQVFSLTPTPIANSFPDKPDSDAERYPLDLMQCPECQHVQLKHVFDAETLYGDYKYSTPDAFVPHLERHAKQLKAKYPNADKVLEIGSNNGQFLNILRKHFRAVVGVDPASDDHRFCHAFSHEFAKELAREWKFDLIVANNVFAHIDDLQDVYSRKMEPWCSRFSTSRR
jgi:SAM-dependent methyltransferase